MLEAARRLALGFILLAFAAAVAAIPFTWGEAAVFEQVFAEGATIESVVAAARESIMACEWAKVARQHYDQVYKPLLSTVRP